MDTNFDIVGTFMGTNFDIVGTYHGYFVRYRGYTSWVHRKISWVLINIPWVYIVDTPLGYNGYITGPQISGTSHNTIRLFKTNQIYSSLKLNET